MWKGGPKLHEAKQDQSVCPNEGFSGNEKAPYIFSYDFLLYIYVIFFSLPITYPGFWYQPFIPEWRSDWAATSSVSMRLTWWDGSNPLVSKYIHIQEENIFSASIMGVQLSPRSPEVYPAVQLVRSCLAKEVILMRSSKQINTKQQDA